MRRHVMICDATDDTLDAMTLCVSKSCECEHAHLIRRQLTRDTSRRGTRAM